MASDHRAPLTAEQLDEMRRRDLHALTQQLICTTENFPEVFDATAASQSDVKLLRYEIERLQARIAELERQRDEVLALCERKEGDPCGTCAYAGVDVDDIRAIYGGGQ